MIGTEVVGRVLHAGGEEDLAAGGSTVPDHVKKHEQLTALTNALEEAGDVEYAGKKKLAKIKAPPMHRPAHDRSCLNASLAELEEMSEKRTAQLNSQRSKLLEEQEAMVLAKAREVTISEEEYKKTLEVISSQRLIAAQLIEKKLQSDSRELQLNSRRM